MIRPYTISLDSTSTISSRRCKLPDHQPTPAQRRIMSIDRYTRGERMSCGILPCDLAGDLQGRDGLRPTRHQASLVGIIRKKHRYMGGVRGGGLAQWLKAGLHASPYADMGPLGAQIKT
ncbi:hypothetical protein CCHR01_18672 [Colletotrichum chrysophilum]|uniref:Uncharacterized protein n=1 Tax=Colletotrichum chrysophilum TaxID=1836956 RepID=A0AAD9A0A3_9PEZI|nr:hypothetical protein CCHR01_18672 [Colletotrichum chrysophilum]